MIKNIYIIRHCEATGQSAESPLSEKGFTQAENLSHFLTDRQIDRIISSPYMRAVQSIKPFAEGNNLEIELDDRLTERVLSSRALPDWLDKLEATFYELGLKYEGGESSKEATMRIVELVYEIIASDQENTMIVAHGGIISLLLHHYDKNFGFEQWKNLSNPDIFVLRISENITSFERLIGT